MTAADEKDPKDSVFAFGICIIWMTNNMVSIAIDTMTTELKRQERKPTAAAGVVAIIYLLSWGEKIYSTATTY